MNPSADQGPRPWEEFGLLPVANLLPGVFEIFRIIPYAFREIMPVPQAQIGRIPPENLPQSDPRKVPGPGPEDEIC